MGVADQTFLITGCASGIGQHLAGALLRRGARVMMADIHTQPMHDYIAHEKLEADQSLIQELDVRDPEAWEAALSRIEESWQRLDVLINVAGVVNGRYIHEASAEDADFHIDINAKGTIYGCIAAVKRMMPQRSGHIINVASVAGLVPVPGISFYSASKFAVRGFSHAMADELEPHGIFVTVVCPNAVATPMLDMEAEQPETMLSFSGTRILTVQDLEKAIIDRALVKRPREIILPASMSIFSRFTTAFPALAGALLPYFRKRGAETQAKYRDAVRRK